eukprot:7518703-Ditylum_brightwellii.AAC.1
MCIRDRPISLRVLRMQIPCWALRKTPANLASVAEATTCLMMVHRVWITPLRIMCLFSWGTEPRKKWPPAVLQACGLDRALDKVASMPWE